MKRHIIKHNDLSDGYKLVMVKTTGNFAGNQNYIVSIFAPNDHEAPEVYSNLGKDKAHNLYEDILRDDVLEIEPKK